MKPKPNGGLVTKWMLEEHFMDVHVQAEVVLVVVLVRDRPFSRDKIDLFKNKNILGTENLCVCLVSVESNYWCWTTQCN